MRLRAMVAATAALGMVAALATSAGAHPGEGDGGHAPDLADGHVAANTNYGFTAVGHTPLTGVQDGRYTDVWAHEGHAYVGSFQDPDCSRAGVYVADLADPTAPEFVGEIKSPPDTRVNDVKVTDVGDRDVLIFSLEKCGDIVGATSRQKGQGGIALWDVTDPRQPHALKQNFLDFQVHNTYPWTVEGGAYDGRTFALVVDDENVDDTHVVELTKPQSPKLVATTGIGTWLDQGLFDEETSELFLGTFAAPLLHDVWVEWNPTTERYEGVLSYWDAGFITIDLSDPFAPGFIDDSDYPEVDPVLGDLRTAFDGRPEGNAHAAVFGGDDNEFIFAGDEDFDSLAITVDRAGASAAANNGSDTPALPEGGLSGDLVWLGEACLGADVPTAGEGDIALISRGTCAFTDKATTASTAGYVAGVVVNNADDCDAGVSMLVAGDIPMVSVSRAGGYGLMGLACEDGVTPTLPEVGARFVDATVGSSFVGWGYFHVINNSGGEVHVSGQEMMVDGQPSPSEPFGAMEHIGYYAPAEVSDPELATGAGDLTMHNLETDVDERDRTFISWYSLGMRAVEWREGHYHDSDMTGQSVDSWNVHEVGRWIADADADEQFGTGEGELVGSNFWGVTQFVHEGTRYVLGSDRNTGLWVFTWECEDATSTLYCDAPAP